MITRDLKKSNDNLVVHGKLIINLSTDLSKPITAPGHTPLPAPPANPLPPTNANGRNSPSLAPQSALLQAHRGRRATIA